jgi:cytochrome P450
VMEDVEIQGYHFPKGTALASVIYLMHRNEKYFEKADDFIPGRWDDEKAKALPKFVYFPFGAGNRMCIGEGFAWMEGIMIMATVAAQFRLRLVPGFTTTIKAGFTLRPKDQILMKVEKSV